MIEGYSADCPLCRLANDGEVLTKLHYEDDLIIVVDCLICGTPMAVAKAHRDYFLPEEVEALRTGFLDLLAAQKGGFADLISPSHRLLSFPPLKEKLKVVMNDPSHRGFIDWEQRQIPNHPHCHLRPLPFPGTNRWEPL